MIDYIPKLPSGQSSFFGGMSLASFALPASVLWGLLLLIAIVVGAITIVLFYHWLRYGFGDRMVILAQVLYSLVVFFCLGAMITSVASYA